MINNLKKKKKKGFTLIELIIVIAIIAVLAAIAVPQFGKIRQKSNVSADIANAKTIHSAVATAIADEKIILPSTSIKYYDLNSVGETNPANIENDIDGKVKPKAVQQSKFVVGVTNEGNVTVYAVGSSADADTASESNKVYPNPATSSIYGK